MGPILPRTRGLNKPPGIISVRTGRCRGVFRAKSGENVERGSTDRVRRSGTEILARGLQQLNNGRANVALRVCDLGCDRDLNRRGIACRDET